VVATAAADPARRQRLAESGAEILLLEGSDRVEQIGELLDELGRRQMTNLLVEGGAELFGSLLDAGAIDEVHAFVGPKLVGGQGAPGPIAGRGIADMRDAVELRSVTTDVLGDDFRV